MYLQEVIKMDGYESRRGVPVLVRLFVFGGGGAIVLAVAIALLRRSASIGQGAGMIIAALGWALAGAFILKDVGRQSIASVKSSGITLEEWSPIPRFPYLGTKVVHIDWMDIKSIGQTGILLSFTTKSRRRNINLRYFDNRGAVVSFAMERWRLSRHN
jgi:hypothetical protein